MSSDVASPSPASPAGVGSRIAFWSGQALLWLSLWLGLIRFPAPPSLGLDPSWRMVLTYALEHGLQYGTDLVFTYGPLGYLLASTNSGSHYADLLVWQVVANAVFATVLWLLGRSLRGWRLAAYYVYFAFFGLGYGDALHMIVIAALSAALLRDPILTRRWLAAVIGALIAVVALIKFTNLMLAGFAVACVCAYHLWSRRWVDLLVVGGSFAATFLGGWMLFGQKLGGLLPFILNSLNASGGYGEGMSVYEDNTTFFFGVTAGLGVGGYFLLSLWRRPDFPKALALCAIAAATSFIDWKHGFIRADGHVFAHYIICLFMVVSFPILLQDDGPLRRTKAALLAVAAFCSLGGMWHYSPVALTDAPATWNYNVKKNVSYLQIIRDLPRNSGIEWANVTANTRIPGVVSMVGNSTVDLLGHDQAYLLFNKLNYTPRPVFQSYFSYTERLLRLNEQFFQSPRAPQYVLQRMDTIDFRLPALDDSLATLYLYQNYDFLTNEGGFLVWRKKNPLPAPAKATPLPALRTSFGSTVNVPEHGEETIWVQVDIKPSLLGRLRSFLYKAPILNIKVTDASGQPTTYRLIRDMARAGFLLYPHFSNLESVEKFARDEKPNRVTAFSIELPPSERKYFNSVIDVKFSTLPALPRAPKMPPEVMGQRFRVFNRLPDAATALFPPNVLPDDGIDVLFAHPPSSLEFQMTKPASRLTGKFGLSSKAYTPPNNTDGTEYIIEWLTPDGKTTVLFDRLLEPVKVEADRGPQSFDIKLPEGNGLLKMRITAGPRNDLSYDWAYWTDVRFEP